jgi:hypothetical protein
MSDSVHGRLIDFKRRCPDCKQEKNILTHHVITTPMVKYLVDVGGFERGQVLHLRNQLTVRICKDCERKFHDDQVAQENARLKKIIRTMTARVKR